MNEKRKNLVTQLENEKLTERIKVNPNLGLLVNSGFRFKEPNLEQFETYVRGRDFIIYCPKTDIILIEYYATLKVQESLSKQRYTVPQN